MAAFLPGTVQSLNEQLPEVAAFVPADQEDGIVSVVADVLNIPEPTQSIVAAHGMLRTIDGASANL